MQLTSHIKNALINLVTSKLRSTLTMLGVLVGTASVVALVSSGQLATENALAQFKTLGTDLLSVSIQASQKASQTGGGQTNLTLEDFETLESQYSDITEIAPYTTDFSQASYNGQTLESGIIGATEDLQKIMKVQLSAGRFVSFLDQYSFFAVVGYDVAQKMRQLGAIDPLGKQILLGTNYFTVIGVAKKWPENMFMPNNINQSIIVPISTSLLLSKYVKISSVVFRFKPGTNLTKLQNELTQSIQGLAPGNQLFFRSPEQIIQSLESQRQTLTLLLALIGSISLIVGGIGVMNIMLVSVVERRREIGVRMAIGAKRKDIQYMFLTEAIMLTVFGGVVGIIVGELISYVTAEVSGWGFKFFALPPIVGFIVSVLVGVFFGFYPALKASRLDPIETLRSE